MSSEASAATAKSGWKKNLIVAGLLLAAGAIGLAVSIQRVDAVPSRQVLYVASAALVASIAVMYAWRRASLWQLRRVGRQQREALLARAAALAETALSETASLAGVTLAWAVRAELMRDDLRDVEEYMLQLGKNARVRRAVVAGREGTVIASTDAALEGQRLDRIVEGSLEQRAEAQKTSEGLLRLVVPIMGLESRMGTLVVEYRGLDLVQQIGVDETA